MLLRGVFRLFVCSSATVAVIGVGVGLFGLVPTARADEHRHTEHRDGHDSRHYVIHDEDAAWLGVSIEEADHRDDGGARVIRVHDNSPAWHAGLREGDVIIEFDGRAIRGPNSLTHRVRDRDPGDRVDIQFLRDGAAQTLEVELGSVSELVETILPELEDRLKDLHVQLGNLDLSHLEALEGLEMLEHLDIRIPNIQIPDIDFDLDLGSLHHLDGMANVEICQSGDCRTYGSHKSRRPTLGVQLVSTTPELRRHLGGDDDAGVLVDRVFSDTAAEEAGIQVGDLIVAIDGDPIRSANHIRRSLAGRAGEVVDVELVRDGSPMLVSVTLREADDD